MENQEKNRPLTIDKDAKIQVVVNRAASANQPLEIDLGRVFGRMKTKKRVYAWVLVLCMAIGVCAPLLMYQFNQPELTVSSVVTLDYDVVTPDPTDPEDESKARRSPVTDLTAPDGTDLDLNQVTSSYVLQNALSGLPLSQPVSVTNLRDNIKIERILSEDSRRQQEVAASMIDDKNSAAYTQVQEIELTYDNKFVVSLTNGFGDPEARQKIHLTDDELATVLDRVLRAYNDYLVTTYLDSRLPDDEISIIDIENLDLLESLDLLRTAEENLYEYCDEKTDAMKAYRSFRTGKSLTDWMENLETVASVNIHYLYSYVYTNSIVKDKDAMVTSYQYQLRTAQNQLAEVNEKIATVKSILDSYKNDEIFVSMQESDSSKSTRTTTDYYNGLVIDQTDNYEKAATLETRIADLEGKIAALNSQKEQVNLDTAEAELKTAVDTTANIYQGIREHMAELFANAENTHYAEYSAAYGEGASFLSANMQKMILGAVLGAVIACVLWFMSALMPEFHRGSENDKAKEAKRA